MGLRWTAAFLLVVLSTLQFINADDFFLEYFTDVTMDCDVTKYNFTSTSDVESRSWLLPSGDIITESDETDHIIVDTENDTLTVNTISDDDFGYYYCLIARADFSVQRIRHGLNVNGPSYGNLLENYKQNAIRGAIAASVLFVCLTGFCLVWNLRFHKRNQRNKAVDELDNAIGEYDLKAYDNVAVDDFNKFEENKNTKDEENKL